MLQTRCQLGLRVAYGTDRHQFARSDHSGYPHGIRRRPEQVCVILIFANIRAGWVRSTGSPIFASIRAGWVRSTGLLRLPPQSCQVVWMCFSALVGVFLLRCFARRVEGRGGGQGALAPGTLKCVALSSTNLFNYFCWIPVLPFGTAGFGGGECAFPLNF